MNIFTFFRCNPDPAFDAWYAEFKAINKREDNQYVPSLNEPRSYYRQGYTPQQAHDHIMELIKYSHW